LQRIYQLEKSAHQSRGGDGESRPLISNEPPEEVFSRALGVELEKICSFYVAKEGELFEEVNQLLKDIGNYTPQEDDDDVPPLPRMSDGHRPSRRLSSSNGGNISDDDIDDSASEEDETTGLNRPRKNSLGRRRTAPIDRSTGDLAASSEFGRSLRRHSTTINDDDHSMMFSSGLYSSGIMLKKRIISLYVQLCELKSYVQLNRTGFKKILKKFDKILDKELKSDYTQAHVDTAYPFKADTKAQLEENIARMESAYADVVTGGDAELAKKDLRSHLREHVVWERNTVWRDLIGIERRGEAASLGQTLLGQGRSAARHGDEFQAVSSRTVSTPVGRFNLPLWLFDGSMYTLLGSIVVFLLLLLLPILEKPEQQNCLALLVFVSILWATEVSAQSPTTAFTDLPRAWEQN
jgi:phosphate transporter